MKSLVLGACMAVGLVVVPAISADAAVKPVKYKNCAALNKKYPHGVGIPGAKDKVGKNGKPVTMFYRNKALYLANKHLDRDGDRISCERR